MFGTFLFDLSTLKCMVEKGGMVVGEKAKMLGNDGLSSSMVEPWLYLAETSFCRPGHGSLHIMTVTLHWHPSDKRSISYMSGGTLSTVETSGPGKIPGTMGTLVHMPLQEDMGRMSLCGQGLCSVFKCWAVLTANLSELLWQSLPLMTQYPSSSPTIRRRALNRE